MLTYDIVTSGVEFLSNTTLRSLMGLPTAPARISASALIMVDLQNTYTRRVMELEGVEAAMGRAASLLARFRNSGRPVIHIVHDAGAGSPYDLTADIGQIIAEVAPRDGEPVIAKNYPSSFEKTDLDAQLKALGISNIVLAGFMTHMCINSTARAGFNLGYSPTIIANTTATRALPVVGGGDVSALAVHQSALAAVADLFALVMPDVADLAD
jgi:nicotinamidase-related amidase